MKILLITLVILVDVLYISAMTIYFVKEWKNFKLKNLKK